MLEPGVAGEAEWICAAADTTSYPVTFFGPPGFPSYARVRFIPDPEFDGQNETDAALPAAHLSDLARSRRTLDILGEFTTTANVCYFSFCPALMGNSEYRNSIFWVSGESYTLLVGQLADVEEWGVNRDLFPDDFSPPAFAWPADHAWVFACDVDPHWAGIGAANVAIEALLADSMIDAVRADPTAGIPRYG